MNMNRREFVRTAGGVAGGTAALSATGSVAAQEGNESSGGEGDGGGGPVEVDPHNAGVPIQPHYVGFGAGLAVIIPLLFTFFQLKYAESPHTSGGNN